MDILWWVIASGAWVVLNLLATVAVAHDEVLVPKQKKAQLALVWLLPLIGALMALIVHWLNADKFEHFSREGDEADRPGQAFDWD